MSQQPKKMAFATKWEWQEHDGTWIPYSNQTSNKIQVQPLNKGYTFTGTNNQSYTIIKQSTEYGIQTNDSTQFQRSCRRISTTDSYVWQYEDDNQNYVDVPSSVSNTFDSYMVGSDNQIRIFKHYYQVSKLTPFTGTQTNLRTNKTRNIRCVTTQVSQNTTNSTSTNTNDNTTDNTTDNTISNSDNNSDNNSDYNSDDSNGNNDINDTNGTNDTSTDSNVDTNQNVITDNTQQIDDNNGDDIKMDDNTKTDNTTDDNTTNKQDNTTNDNNESKTDDNTNSNNDKVDTSNNNVINNNNNNNKTQTTFDTFWQFEDNGSKYTDMGSKVCQKLDNAQVGATINYKVKRHSYSTVKDDDYNATQTNTSTQQQRHLRKILFDKTNNKRVILEYQDRGNWYYGYDLDTIQQFDNASVNSTIKYSFNNQNYIITKLSSTTGTQLNTGTKYQRKIRRTLIDKSYPDTTQNSPNSGLNSNLSSNAFLNFYNFRNNLMQNPVVTTTTTRRRKKKKNGPPVITKRIGKERKDFKFQQAIDLFNKTMAKYSDIYSIESLYHSNENIYDLLLKNKQNDNQPTDEEFAFHGTTWDNIQKIKKNGFNRDFNVTALYGRGTYFAKDADYSDQYADIDQNNKKCLLVCKLIVGNKIQGNGSMITPPTMKDNITQYDTLVDDPQTPSIWVVTRDFYALPIYALIYE